MIMMEMFMRQMKGECWQGQIEKLVVGKLKSADGKNFLVLGSLGNELLKLDLFGIQ